MLRTGSTRIDKRRDRRETRTSTGTGTWDNAIIRGGGAAARGRDVAGALRFAAGFGRAGFKTGFKNENIGPSHRAGSPLTPYPNKLAWQGDMVPW